jgi:hypothetical protein
MRRIGVVVVAALVAGWSGAGAAPAARAGTVEPVTSDFDGDGRADLAITTPFDDVDGVENSGSVTILYGSEDGLGAARSRLFSQHTPGIADEPEPFDFFGWAAEAGDFDGDGFGDLAVAVLGEDLGAQRRDAGAVHVLYGSPRGLTVKRSQLWTESSPGVPGTAEAGDVFGSALAAGDANDDGRADLAIGIRGKEVVNDEEAGAVVVLLGSAGGLTGDGALGFTQDSPGMLDRSEPTDMFGTGLAMGDLDGDGFDDLAIGVIGEDLGVPATGVGDAGAVAVLYGSADGPTTAGNQLWTQDSPGVPGEAETPDLMGESMAIGDFDGDGFGDLAADSFAESVGNIEGAGGITVLYGSAGGLTSDGAQEITQATPGVPDTAQRNEFFGDPVAAGDFDGDGRDELVAGIAGEGVEGNLHAGAAYVMPGSAGGLTPEGGVLWTQDSPGVRDQAERNDGFGAALAIGNFGRGSHPDLAITARTESVGGVPLAGSVTVLYAGTDGLTANGNQLWTRDREGVPGVAAAEDWFGSALAAA